MISNIKQVRSLAMLLFGMAIAAGPVYAQGDGSIMNKLDLSSQQREQIKSLTERFTNETATLRNDIKRLLEEEKRLKSAASPSEDALRRKMRERADKEIELSLALTKFQEQVEKVLTPAQRQTLARLKADKSR